MGVPLASRGLAQVSMNLTGFRNHGDRRSVRSGAGRGEQTGSGDRRQRDHWLGTPASADRGGGPAAAMRESRPGHGCWKIAWNAREEDGRSIRFWNRSRARASPLGGGSAAALTGAIGASLGHMAARISKVEASHFLAHREYFANAVERDAGAFEAIRTGGGQSAWRTAALVPTEISEQARELDRDLLQLKDQAPAKVHPDITTALALARASRAGGIAAAKSNLPFVEDDTFRVRWKTG